jgi:hypothetical protein
MFRRSVPTSVTVALTILGTAVGMKISTLLPKTAIINSVPVFNAENQSRTDAFAYH